MKAKLTNYLQKNSYPQKEFVASILPFIDKAKNGLLVDVPCGKGVTSWNFSRLKKLSVYGYDIDASFIEQASVYFKASNLTFKALDINAAIKEQREVDYFCIINSLFLLQEPNLILANIKKVMKESGTLFIILPNIEGPNFKWFQNKFPDVNKLILNKVQMEPYFSSNGWVVSAIIPIVYAKTFGRKDVYFFSIFSPIYLRLINFIQSYFHIAKPNYFTLILNKYVD